MLFFPGPVIDPTPEINVDSGWPRLLICLSGDVDLALDSLILIQPFISGVDLASLSIDSTRSVC